MIDGANLGVIDFQDALMGPAVYDLASLLRDAYIALDEPVVDALIGHYLDAMVAEIIVLPTDLTSGACSI